MKAENPEKKKKILAAAIIAATIIVLVVIGVTVGVPLVKFASQPELFREWVESHGVWGYIAYAGMVIFQVVVALVPGEPFEIAAGYTFGAVKGTVLCILAAAAGSMIVFALVKKFGRSAAELFFTKEKLNSLQFLKSGSKRDILFLIIFMIPGTPKDLLCYFAGLTDIKFPMWLFICSVGRIPSVITSAIGGDALGTKKYALAAVVFAVTILISLLGLFIYNKISKKHENHKKV